MLSRSAACLYWMGRYMERAENLSRIIEVGFRLSQIPEWESSGPKMEWESSALAAACDEGLLAKHGEANLESVIAYIALDEDNPSSIHSCFKAARTNGRTVRTALTSDMWECLNDTWLEFNSKWLNSLKQDNLWEFLDWVKMRTNLFRGAILGTMLRDNSFAFTNIGTFIERASNTARILDVKYHILLPPGEQMGGALDYTQWVTLLRSVTALGSYHWVYRDSIKPWNVAELLILKEQMPRSLVYCMSRIERDLLALNEHDGQRYDCHRIAGKMHSQLNFASIDDVFQSGLHEYLAGFLAQNDSLDDAISSNYHFYS